MAINPISPWRRSDNLNSRRHQELVDGINGLLGFPAGDIDYYGAPSGGGYADLRGSKAFIDVVLKVVSMKPASGAYGCKIGIWKDGPIVDVGSANVDWDDLLDWPDDENCVLLNEPELKRSPAKHRIPVDGTAILSAVLIPPLTTDGDLVCLKNYSSAFRWARIKPDGTYLQFTTRDVDDPSLLPDDAWLDVIPLQQCTSTPTETLLSLMT